MFSLRSAYTSENLQRSRRGLIFSRELDNTRRKKPIEIKAMSAEKVPKAKQPRYEEMIKSAIRTLKERNGSSRQAIEKHIIANYKVGDTAPQHIRRALKKGADNGTFVHTKGVGASGSFKLAKEEKKPSKKPTVPKKKPVAKAAKKPVAKKQTTSKKSSRTKSPSSKKNASKEPVVKKPSAKTAAAKPKLASQKPGTKKEVKKPAAMKKSLANKKK